MGLPSFSLDVRPGNASVVINGEDVSDRVNGIALEHGVGRVPVLILQQPVGAGRIEGEGIVEVHVGEDAASAVEAFLAHLDPTALEERALAQMGYDGEASTGRAFLAALRQMAEEQR